MPRQSRFAAPRQVPLHPGPRGARAPVQTRNAAFLTPPSRGLSGRLFPTSTRLARSQPGLMASSITLDSGLGEKVPSYIVIPQPFLRNGTLPVLPIAPIDAICPLPPIAQTHRLLKNLLQQI